MSPALKAAKAEFRRLLQADGFCSRCLYREAEPGFGKCDRCLKVLRKYRTRLRKRLRKAGVCRLCTKNPRKKGFINCHECIEAEKVRVRAAMRELRKVRKQETGYANPPKEPPKTPTEPKEETPNA
jgi:hypothetical protein